MITSYKHSFAKIFNILLYLVLVVAIGQSLIRDIDTVKGKRPFFILRNLGMSYNAKMEIAIGRTSYDYALFIKENTPKNSNILVPPMGYPWPHTSNVGYFRYFLYPRNLINGEERKLDVNLKKVDFVLIDYGETTISQYGYTNVWPKFNVSGQYIIYWDPKTGKTWKDATGIYKYTAGDQTERWGLIKISN